MYRFTKNLNSKPNRSPIDANKLDGRDLLEKLISVKVQENRRLFQQVAIKIEDRELRLQTILSNVKKLINDHSEEVKSMIDAEKRELLNFVDEEGKFKMESWKEQSREIQKALIELTMWEKKTVKISSVKELNARLCNLTKQLMDLQVIEDCRVHFTPSRDNLHTLGQVAIAPCLKYIEVDACEEAIANQFNTCLITVRDRLKRIVKDVNYMLTLYLVDRSNNPIYFVIRNLKNGCFRIDFYPLEKGKLYMYIMLDSLNICCSPKEISVKKETEAHKPVLVIGEAGKDNGQFCRPWGICCDSRGRIIIADRTNNRIQVFTAGGMFFGKFGKEGSSPGEFNKPAGITVDKYDRIIVADKDNHRIQIFDSNGNYIIHFGKSATEEESLNFPWDVAANEFCNIAVTETKKRRIRLYTDSGVLLREMLWTGNANLDSPRGIACASDGSFLVTDFERHKVIWVNENFENVKHLGAKGMRPSEFNRPQGIACGPNMFAVSDSKNHRIQIYKNDILYNIIGRFGTEPGEFDTPQGLVFHPNGNLIVVDFGNNKIQVFDMHCL